MWIKDNLGDCINAAAVSSVYVNKTGGTHNLNITLINDPAGYILKEYGRKEDAEAARDALIRKLGGEVIEV